MAKFRDYSFNVGAMSAGDLDTIALEKGGHIGSIGFGYDLAGPIPTLAGGWSARWITRQGMGNHGQLVLVPTDRRTRALASEGRIRLYQASGLTRMEAERLHHKARARYKGELLPILARVLADRGQVMALLAYPGYGHGSGRGAWRQAWGDILDSDITSLTAPREQALAWMVQAICT